MTLESCEWNMKCIILFSKTAQEKKGYESGNNTSSSLLAGLARDVLKDTSCGILPRGKGIPLIRVCCSPSPADGHE